MVEECDCSEKRVKGSALNKEPNSQQAISMSSYDSHEVKALKKEIKKLRKHVKVMAVQNLPLMSSSLRGKIKCVL